MESRLAQAVTEVQSAEKQFDQALTISAISLEDVIALLQEYRRTAHQVSLCDFLYSRSTDVETRLWSAHSRLNSLLRKQLSKLRKERSNKPVESRKHTKLYLEFLKDSQRFYRNYIQRLNSRFNGIAELQRIAQQVKSESVDPSLQEPVSPEVQAQVILSCHQTLIYLGDLFRYRAAEKLDKVPDWGPAIGYYALAIALRPSSGMAFHQQSVVAFEQGDYLRSTYYLYRAIVVTEPHPNATANLELQFKKITAGWDRGELIPKHSPSDRSASRKALISWFVRFHSMCYRGQHFSQYEELEKEVLSRVAYELKKRTLDGILSKMVFINVAAQATATTRFQSKPDAGEALQAYSFFLRLNVKFFATLLDTFREDVQDHYGQDQRPGTEQPLAKHVSDQARHVLPCLCLYSAWLLSNADVIAARGVYDATLLKAIDQFWKSYTATLSAMADAFPIRELPDVSYQLEEDVDAFGFMPLVSDNTQKLWHDAENAGLKPKFSDLNLCRLDPNAEMLGRVRRLLMDGLHLAAVEEDVPITFDGTKFVVVKDESDLQPDLRSNILPREQKHVDAEPPHVQAAPEALQTYHSPPPAVPSHVQAAPSLQPKPHTREVELKNMVDDLVGPEDDEDENLPPTPPLQPSEPGLGIGYYGVRNGSFAKGTSPPGLPPIQTPDLHPVTASWHSSNSPLGRSSQRLQSVSSIWNDTLLHNSSPLTPNQTVGNLPGRIPSNASMHLANGHSRANSGISVRSSVPNHNGWSSFEPTPQNVPHGQGRMDRLNSFQAPEIYGQYYGGMNSPLLFGAGQSPWSTGPRKSLPSMGDTPPNGQGG